MRQLALVEELLDLSVATLRLLPQMMSEHGRDQCEGEARGLYLAARVAADWVEWPEFEEWKGWALEALGIDRPAPAAEPTGRDWHFCADWKCHAKNFAPLTRCEKCDGPLMGIAYPTRAA